jgi:uncharacterized C2H2 Zn-finger protein
MVEHKCQKCDVIFNKKSNYEKHVNRKNPCNLELSEGASSTQAPINSTQEANMVEEHKCSYCSKIFSRKDSLYRHINDYCISRKEHESQKEDIYHKLLDKLQKQETEMELIKKENKKMQKKIKVLESGPSATITNNNIDKQQNVDKQQINNNINNNIKLIAFGDEDLSYITDSVCKEILKKGFQSYPKLIEYTHFDVNKPEHHNIYKPNNRTDTVITYDGSDWSLCAQDVVLDKLKDASYAFLDSKINEFKQKGMLNEAALTKLERFIKEREDEPQQTNLQNDIKLLMYNKRNIVKETKKKVEKANKLLK